MGFPGSLMGKELACQWRRCKKCRFDPWAGKIPLKEGMTTQYSYLENPHGQRSLVGYSPWGDKKSDMTERLTHTHTHTNTHIIINTYENLLIALGE